MELFWSTVSLLLPPVSQNNVWFQNNSKCGIILKYRILLITVSVTRIMLCFKIIPNMELFWNTNTFHHRQCRKNNIGFQNNSKYGIIFEYHNLFTTVSVARIMFGFKIIPKTELFWNTVSFSSLSVLQE